MQEFIELSPLIITMLLTGVVGGVLAGLLGVGGGIVIVPILDFALKRAGVDSSVTMHIAVATSLATIVPTSLSSVRAHHRRGAVDFSLARSWGLYIFIGSVLGTLLASRVNSTVLSLLFATVAILVAIKMVLPLAELRPSATPQSRMGNKASPLVIGGLSSMIGIGGGTLSVPALTMMNVPMHRAVGTSALFGLLISLPGALSYVATGWNDPRMPTGNLGYVSLVGLGLIAPMTVLSAPLGAKLSHRLSQRYLSLAFGVFLLLISVRMLHRAFS